MPCDKMTPMTSAEIRQSFLEYFRERGHRIVASSPLVPGDDPTLLFTNAGMNQFKDLFLGAERREYRRATTSQKCMRVSGKHNDLENVGPSLRHHTFFEMLGNFSFGDYFKADAIPFAWELLTGVWNLPAERLYATVFKGEDGVPRDDEAYAIWERLVPASRIAELGAAENFWAMGETGPCGRCSEIHYHRGDHLPCSTERCLGIDCDCDRYVEIWNNVFMEFERRADGSLTPLPAPSIDTGMGLERIVAVLQDKLSNYDTDLFSPLLTVIGERAGTEYGPLAGRPANDTSDVSLRVIADHLRAMTFLIADGVVPSNEWRGYVLRKIMRRAMRHGKKLGLTEPFLHELTGTVIGEMAGAYPELETSREAIASVVRREETQFDRVLRDGLPHLEAALADACGSGPAKVSGGHAGTGSGLGLGDGSGSGAGTAPDAGEEDGSAGGVVAGDVAFRLYDTFGMPLDFVEDMAQSRSLRVDRQGFERAMEGQRARARAGAAFGGLKASLQLGGLASKAELPVAPSESFVGYDTTSATSVVTHIFQRNDSGTTLTPVDVLNGGEGGHVVLDTTPFYLEAGGQVSDTGRLFRDGVVEADVRNIERLQPGWPRMHVIAVRDGTLRVGDTVEAEVDAERRDAIRRNHTATHLLHAALRQIVGTHVRQAGSLVDRDRLRFDITHHEAVTADQLHEIELLVNNHAYRNQTVETEEKPTEEAMAAGAMALFGEKYGERVRVVTVPGFSVELCGGTHCRATGDIGTFIITHEGGVAAGVRRIEAVTGATAVETFQNQGDELSRMAYAHETTADHAVAAIDRLHNLRFRRPVNKVHADQAANAVRKLAADYKRLVRENERLRVQAAMGTGAAGTVQDDGAAEVNGVRVVSRVVSGLEPGALRTLADSLRDRLGSGVVVLASDNDGKAALVVSVTRDLTDRVHAGNLIKELAPIVGGRGGGRPDFAQAGGRNVDRINAIAMESRDMIGRMLAGS